MQNTASMDFSIQTSNERISEIDEESESLANTSEDDEVMRE